MCTLAAQEQTAWNGKTSNVQEKKKKGSDELPG
jgi:hypothetical protein